MAAKKLSLIHYFRKKSAQKNPTMSENSEEREQQIGENIN